MLTTPREAGKPVGTACEFARRAGELIPQEDAGSSRAPMSPADGARSVGDMKRRLFFLLVVTGLLVLAIGGWTVQGLRWAVTGGWSRGLPQPA